MINWLVCHDAGGAELVSSWAKARNPGDYLFVLEGPAVAIFRRKIPEAGVVSRDEFMQKLSPGDWVLTGTGWASDLEKRSIREAKNRGARVTSFLDHWSNYGLRFELDGKTELPHEIWVGDRYARDLATQQFPGTKVTEVPSDYLRETTTEIARLEGQIVPPLPTDQTRILYVCEAITERMGRPETGPIPEFAAIEKFLAWIQANPPPGGALKVRLRLHPAESAGKYDEITRRHPDIPMEISAQTTLAQDCAWSQWVAGMGSMAMVVALAAGKKVFSSMPLATQRCPLPHQEIISI